MTAAGFHTGAWCVDKEGGRGLDTASQAHERLAERSSHGLLPTPHTHVTPTTLTLTSLSFSAAHHAYQFHLPSPPDAATLAGFTPCHSAPRCGGNG